MSGGSEAYVPLMKEALRCAATSRPPNDAAPDLAAASPSQPRNGAARRQVSAQQDGNPVLGQEAGSSRAQREAEASSARADLAGSGADNTIGRDRQSRGADMCSSKRRRREAEPAGQRRKRARTDSRRHRKNRAETAKPVDLMGHGAAPAPCSMLCERGPSQPVAWLGTEQELAETGGAASTAAELACAVGPAAQMQTLQQIKAAALAWKRQRDAEEAGVASDLSARPSSGHAPPSPAAECQEPAPPGVELSQQPSKQSVQREQPVSAAATPQAARPLPKPAAGAGVFARLGLSLQKPAACAMQQSPVQRRAAAVRMRRHDGL